MALELISIDFWNTIIDSSNGDKRNAYRLHALKEQIALLGRIVSDEEFESAMKATWKFFNKIWDDEMRTPLPIESVEFFWDYLDLPKDKDAVFEVIKAFSECNLIYKPELIAGVGEALEILSKKYKIGLISDTGFSPGSVLRKLMKDKGVYDYFDAFSFSDETGVSKPHPKAYETIFGPMNIKPENCLHIGDIEKTDVSGAKNLGMRAIRFSGNPTEYVSGINPSATRADAEIDSWSGIVEWIEKNG